METLGVVSLSLSALYGPARLSTGELRKSQESQKEENRSRSEFH